VKDEAFWKKEAVLKDLLYDSNMQLDDVAKHLYISRSELNTLLKKNGLNWVRRYNRKVSRGQASLTQIMKNILPNEEIINEHHIGDRLRLDVYCPSYSLAAEYHGRQHFFYSNLFHNSIEDFEEGVERDRKKEERCRELGIALVVFRFCDKLDEETVFRRMLEAIKSTPRVEVEKTRKTFKGNHYYEKMKQHNRDYRKAKYRELKRKNGPN
jgi:hypothetical protein